MWLSRLFTSENDDEEIIKSQGDIVRLGRELENNALTMPLNEIIEGILDDKKIMKKRLEDIAILVAKQIRAIDLEILHSKNPDDLNENKYLIENQNLANQNLNNLILLIYNLSKEIANSNEIAIKVVFFYKSLVKDYNKNIKISDETESQTLINLYDFKKLYLRGYIDEVVVKNYFGKR